MMDKPAIGYVGIGLMGLPMTKHLLSRGYTVRAYDIVPAQMDAAKTAGAAIAESPAAATEGADFVLLNLPTTDAVEAAVFDASRLPECLAGGHADGTLLQNLYPRMVARDFRPQGYARQLLKDLEMVNEFADGLKAPLPMMMEALSLYRILVHIGHSELDTSALLKVYERS